MNSVLVCGSANLDTSVRVAQHPHPGETVLGRQLGRGAGGKGLNQAIAAARAGCPTRFAGAVGKDDASSIIRRALEDADVGSALGLSDQPTGSAFVMVSPSGENAIVVTPGANDDPTVLTARFTEAVAACDGSDVVLAQLEVPLPAVRAALRHARARGTRTILNAAPSQELPVDLLEEVDVLIVNQHECLDIAGPSFTDPVEAALALARTVATVVVTLGGDGAVTVESEVVARYGAYAVAAVDTTAAGDTFCGALAAELATGASLADSVRVGTAAAALTVQTAGAAGSIPARADILAFQAANVPKAPPATSGEPG